MPRRSEVEALASLLPPARRSGNREYDLTNAVREALRRREHNTAEAGAIVRALRDDYGWTYRSVEEHLGVPYGTAARWALSED